VVSRYLPALSALIIFLVGVLITYNALPVVNNAVRLLAKKIGLA
jgi:hypothetical protein